MDIGGHTMTLLSVAADSSSAAVMVDSATSTAAPGDVVANEYKVMSLVDPCATFNIQNTNTYFVLCVTQTGT